jgi:hypothetical protein
MGNALADRAREEERKRDAALTELDRAGQSLGNARREAKAAIEDCQELINSIKKTPIDFKLKSSFAECADASEPLVI